MNVRQAIRARLRHRLLIGIGKFNRLMRRNRFEDAICDYELMCDDNRSSAKVYQAGKFWERLNRYHKDIIWGGGLQDLRNQYFNRTFAGPEPESRQVYRALLFLYHKVVSGLDIDGFLTKESEPSMGGDADQEIFEGRSLSIDFLQSVEEAYFLRQAWTAAGRSGEPRLIVELGAGYGRLAYVCRRMMPQCTYVILDLPEALTCSSSWLSKVLSEEVVPYTRSRVCEIFSREKLMSEKVWTLGAHQIEAISDGAVDAFINIYSFAEMPRESIAGYFAHIDRITRGVLYSKQRKLEQNVHDQTSVSQKDYPVRDNWRMLFERTTTLYDNFFECAYAIGAHDCSPRTASILRVA